MEVVLGTMNFGGRTPDAEAQRIMERAYERGVRRFDTANLYTDGESERLVGQAAQRHPELELTTKVGIGTLRGKPEGLAPKTITEALDESLKRLGVERVARYYLHKPDPQTPIAHTVEALEAERARGRIGAWGVSNFAAWQTLEALGTARPIGAQMLYNALIRDLEHEWFSFSRAHRVPIEVYNPLAGGLLTGKHAPDQAAAPGSRFDKNPLYRRRYWSDRMFEVARELAEIAQKAAMSPVELAYRWLLDAPIEAVVLGPATLDQLDQALDAIARGPLAKEVRGPVDEAYQAYRGTDARYAR